MEKKKKTLTPDQKKKRRERNQRWYNKNKEDILQRAADRRTPDFLEKRRKRSRERYQLNKEKYKQEYYDNREKILEKKKEYYRINKAKIHQFEATPQQKSYRRSLRLKRFYGITIEDYWRMFDGQKGKCKICKRIQAELNHILFVDHCHKTGKVRGLLCFTCNAALGNVRDNIEVLQSAIKYLKSFQK